MYISEVGNIQCQSGIRQSALGKVWNLAQGVEAPAGLYLKRSFLVLVPVEATFYWWNLARSSGCLGLGSPVHVEEIAYPADSPQS